MRSLWFVSSSLWVLVSCNSFVCKTLPAKNNYSREIVNVMDTAVTKKFEARISYKTTEITGILICKNINDSNLSGSFLNEFGIKGFDFTIQGNKTRMGYVIKNLDKWYIRRVLKSDLHFMFFTPKNMETCSVNDTLDFWYQPNHSRHYGYEASRGENHYAVMYKGKKKVAEMKQFSNSALINIVEMKHLDGTLKYELKELKSGEL